MRLCATAFATSLLALGACAQRRDSGSTIDSLAAVVDSNAALPAWAFPVDPPAATPAPQPDSITPLSVPGSTRHFTLAQAKDFFAPPDWHPAGHPPMPGVVAHGRKPTVFACAYCHLPNGLGRPENASLAGLPAEYIRRQVADMRSGARRVAWTGPRRPGILMWKIATAATDSEVALAAAYFSVLPQRVRVQVTEVDSVPKTKISGFLYVPIPDAGSEPLGSRIIEVATDHERHELRDDQSGFIAYVPRGSIDRGERIVRTGSDSLTTPCATCHGPDLHGVGAIPAIAGRSPSYIVRQLLAFQTGRRNTVAGQPMRTVAAKLKVDDMVAIAAYVASRTP